MQSPPRASRAACPWIVPLAWVFLGTALSASEGQESASVPGAGACELVIEGSHLVGLTLEGPRGHFRHLASPGPRLRLPAGEYCVRQIDLEGGYGFIGSSAADAGWFTLTPKTPHQMKVGPPFTSSVKVARRGRFLTLDYQLLDAGGRNYRSGQPGNRPRFTVYRGDREIGSGSFEYG